MQCTETAYRNTKNTVGMAVAVTMVLALTISAPVHSQSGGDNGADERLVTEKCSNCHALSQVTAQSRTAHQWATVIEDMILKGATISDEEFFRIVDHLAKEYGPDRSDNETEEEPQPCP